NGIPGSAQADPRPPRNRPRPAPPGRTRTASRPGARRGARRRPDAGPDGRLRAGPWRRPCPGPGTRPCRRLRPGPGTGPCRRPCPGVRPGPRRRRHPGPRTGRPAGRHGPYLRNRAEPDRGGSRPVGHPPGRAHRRTGAAHAYPRLSQPYPGPGPRSHAGQARTGCRAAAAAAPRRSRTGAGLPAAGAEPGKLSPERRREHHPWRLHRRNRPGIRGRHTRNTLAAHHCRAGPAGRRSAMTEEETATRSPGARWRAQLAVCEQRVSARQPTSRQGRVTRATGLVLEAIGLQLPVGAACKVQVSPDQDRWADAEVVGFHADTLYLMPQSDITGLPPGARIIPAETLRLDPVPLPDDPAATPDAAAIITDQVRHLPVGNALLGRVLDGAGRPLDGKPLPADLDMAP